MKKKKQFIPPKHVQKPQRSLYVQIDSDIWLEFSKFICRKDGRTWKFYIQAMMADFLKEQKS